MADVIVVGTDGSDTASRAVTEAARLAKALGADVHIVSAFEPLRGARVTGAPEGAAKVWAPLPDSKVESVVEQAATSMRLAGLSVSTHVSEKDPADALIDVAEEVGANFIVVGNQGMHGARRFALGNVPNKVSHRARCNVLIVSTDSTDGA
jgi:nucleotide-binding universal stress UspA family protein